MRKQAQLFRNSRFLCVGFMAFRAFLKMFNCILYGHHWLSISLILFSVFLLFLRVYRSSP